jgi:hypothetical protein
LARRCDNGRRFPRARPVRPSTPVAGGEYLWATPFRRSNPLGRHRDDRPGALGRHLHWLKIAGMAEPSTPRRQPATDPVHLVEVPNGRRSAAAFSICGRVPVPINGELAMPPLGLDRSTKGSRR